MNSMRIVLALLALLASTAANAKTTHLRLSAEIDDNVADDLVTAIADAPSAKGDAIVIEFNSPGGEVDSGFRIAKAIERYPRHVACIIDGEADSMASYVFESCDTRAMTKRSLIMIHQPGMRGFGQINDIQNAVDWLRASGTALFSHYAMHMRISIDDLMNRTAGGREMWLDWKDAKRFGAVDIVVDRVEDLE